MHNLTTQNLNRLEVWISRALSKIGVLKEGIRIDIDVRTEHTINKAWNTVEMVHVVAEVQPHQ